MATTKGKRTSSGTKKNTARSAPAKRGAASPKRKAPPKRGDRFLSPPMVGVLVFGLALVLLIVLFSTNSAGAILYARAELNAWFGSLRYVYVLLLAILGLQIAFGDRWPIRKGALLLAALMCVCIGTLLQVFRTDDLYKMLSTDGLFTTYNNYLYKSYHISKTTPYAGGLIGALLGYPMGKYLDILGSALVLFFSLGALFMFFIKMVVPGAGESMSSWFENILDDFGEWRQERAAGQDVKRAERAEMTAREADQALLVPIPEELLEPDEEEAPPPQRAKPSVARGKAPAAAAKEARPTRPAPQPQASAPAEPAMPEYEMPTPKFAKATKKEPPKQPPAEEAPQSPRARLYIEDILPEDAAHMQGADGASERPLQRPHTARREPDAVPDFIAKRRAQYDEAYGAFATQEPGEAPADARLEQAADEAETPDNDGREIEHAHFLEPEPEPEPITDIPWEPIEESYTPEEEPPRPVRRRRARQQNPLDYQPTLDAETRLDRPDWKPEPPEPQAAAVAEQIDEYRQPPYSLLIRDEGTGRVDTRVQDAENAQKLEETLLSFGVDARVIKVVHGPAVTRYELQPAPGVKVSKIVNLTDDIALNMAAMGVRIEAPIPGKAAIGIEIANADIATVHLRDVLESDESIGHPSKLAVALGKDIAGKRIIADLARMPHLLIAGATGSGKSVCINTIITSIIYRATPEEVRLILIDPKKVELSMYNGIPHLLVPVVTDAKKASGALSWAVMEMDERYRVFAEAGVRDIRGYNAQRGDDTPLMPQIVVIIDELSDLMLVAPGEVEDYICRIAQLARACGIHLVIATQRPSVNVITGIIKANVPSRIAFAVSSQVDSRTILDGAGAEKLLGKGDMLYAPSGGGKPMRVQGCFVSDKEVARVTEYVKDRHTTDYSQAVIDALSGVDEELDTQDEDANDANEDALYEQAIEMAVESGQASISMLQRRLRIGYARAGRLIDDMARRGIISQADGAKPREVLITREDIPLYFKR